MELSYKSAGAQLLQKVTAECRERGMPSEYHGTPAEQYIATYYSPRGFRQTIKTGAYDTRDEAARALFTLCRKAKSCQTARAPLVDGKPSDIGGFDIRFHNRHDYAI